MSEKTLRKVQFGSGGNLLEGWENYDAEVDISKPLDPTKFPDNSVDAIYLSHVIEHITHLQAFDFFGECMRILKPGATLRIVFPSIESSNMRHTKEWGDFNMSKGWAPDNSKKMSVRSLIANHGHQSVWTQATMAAYFGAHGFERIITSHPKQPEDQHWKVVGKENDAIESEGMMGYKPLKLPERL